jgi:hypothetical protein
MRLQTPLAGTVAVLVDNFVDRSALVVCLGLGVDDLGSDVTFHGQVFHQIAAIETGRASILLIKVVADAQS